LLERVGGIDRGLQRGKRAHDIGRLAFLMSAVGVLAATFTSGWWSDLASFDWSSLTRAWPLALGVAVLVLSILLINWTRLWVEESRRPFRYTYSIDTFKPVDGSEPEPRLAWLRDDLAKRLSERIGRLALLDERYSQEVEPQDSHIHVGGSYGVRVDSTGRWAIEVMPWIRLGPPGESASLAHPVKFELTGGRDELRGDDKEGPDAYEKLVERIYFSIASELYNQIRQDVQGKIELLPRRYYRAAAYYFEAEDYVRSNTLEAYTAARELYAAVIRLYDPCWGGMAQARPARMLQRLDGVLARWALFWRRKAKSIRPQLGRVELMVARAQLGYANTLLYRRALAGVSGQRLNPIFEAPQVAAGAEERLRLLGEDVPGQKETWFEALVTRAGVLEALGSNNEAGEYLAKARELDSFRAEQDSRYLYVRSRVAARPAQFLQRAVELDPFFDVAQFELAVAIEMLWRRRPTLERSVAEIVAAAYDRVLALNPANIAAWANLGYVYWLLAGLDDMKDDYLADAERALSRGREYKEIRPETFVAELDYGLARIAAEGGAFPEAYRHYINAVTAQVAQGMSHDPDGFTNYHFAYMTKSMLERFEQYRERVREAWEKSRNEEPEGSTRLFDSVYAFVLNDFGEANMNYFLRSGDLVYLGRARAALEDARENLGTRYPMISYNLNRLERWNQRRIADLSDDEVAGREVERAVLLNTGDIEHVLRYEPDWEDAMLEQAMSYADRVAQARALADRLDDLALRSDRLKRRRIGGGVRRSDAYDPLERWTTFHEEAARISEHPTMPAMVPPAAAAPVAAAPQLPAPQPPIPLPLASPGLLAVGVEVSSSSVEVGGDEGKALRKRAQTLRADAIHYETAARRRVKNLLPQPWLKTVHGGLDLTALDREDIRRSRRWQRELDDLHVKALLAWCRILATRSGQLPGRDAARLLKHLQEQFRPDDFQVLLECHRLPGFSSAERKEYTRRLAAVVRQWVRKDPSWLSLNWVEPDPDYSPDLFTPEERAALYARAASERNVPDDVYFWLGDRLRELGRERDAYIAYSGVLASRDPSALLTLGERFQELSYWDKSLEAFKQARALDPGGHVHHVDVYRRAIGRALWKISAYPDAVREFGETTDGGELGGKWRTTLVDELLRDSSVETSQRYRLLKRWLGQQLTTAQVGSIPAARRDAAAAILLLTEKRYQRLVRRREEQSSDDETMMPWVSPLVLEADASFFPDGDQTEEVVRMIRYDIPALRRDVGLTFGLTMPAVRIAPSLDAGTSSYRVSIDEIPRANGSFDDGEVWFAPDAEAAGAHGLAGKRGVDPLTGHDGLWLATEESVPDFDVWDRYAYMLRHLHAVVVANLDRLVGVQEVERMLDAWSREASTEHLQVRAEALLDERARIRLVAVVRLLAAEQVPLVDLAPVLHALAKTDRNAEPAAIAESVRAALRTNLPGAQHSRVRMLPPQLEDRIDSWLQVRDGKRFLAAPVEELEIVRAAIRGQLVGDMRTPLVVLTLGLRPFVRRLVALDFPLVPVLARSELPDLRLPMPLLSVPLVEAPK
jgi:hypothetical protein